MPWRYDSAGYLDRPSQGSEGTIYAIEHINGSRYPGSNVDGYPDSGNNKSIVILDGKTGQVTARVALPSATSTGPNGTFYYEPKTIGPIVGSDGNAYVVVGNGTGVTSESWALLQLSRAGQMSGVGICSGACSNWKVYQLVPDGVGGLLIRVTIAAGSGGQSEARLIRFNADWERTEHVIGLDTRIDLVGQAGTIYLQSRTGTDDYFGITQAFDVGTGATLWTATPGFNLLAAAPDGGGAALGPAGELVHVDATGPQSPLA